MVHESVTLPVTFDLCKSDQPDRDDPRAVRAAKDFQNVSILRNTNCKMHVSGWGVMAQRPRYAGWPVGGLTLTMDYE